jgi:hypothetical protein
MTARRLLELLVVVAKYFIGMAEKELRDDKNTVKN